jgi:hypothetical protein
MSDVITAWQGALEAAKIRKPLVRYGPGTDAARTCASCGYHDGGRCLIVAGVTGDAGTCDLWREIERNQDGT